MKQQLFAAQARRFGRCICSLLVLLSTNPISLFGQKPVDSQPFELIPDESRAFDVLEDRRIDRNTRQAVALYNPAYKVRPADPETMARQYLRAAADDLKLGDPELGDLDLLRIREGNAGTTVRFLQNFQQVPVYDSEIAVTISPQDMVCFVMNDYRVGLSPMNTVPALSAETARDIALAQLDASGALHFEATRLVVYRNNSGQYLAYEVRLEPEHPLGYWEVLVDAHTGDVRKAQNKTLHADPPKARQPQLRVPYAQPSPPPVPVNGTGSIFNPDPLSSAQVAYGGLYDDNNDNNNASLAAEVVVRPLLDIDLTGGVYSLNGPWAEIQDFEAPNRGLFSQASPNFIFNRQQNGFEAVNTYYFIDMSMRYLNDTLGCMIRPFQYATGVRFDPSGLNGADNSHYLGGSGRLAFGEGGVDDAEDADVILHELGHGLHDWVTGGSLSQVNGLSEGSGDYWAMSYSRSLNQWATTDAAYHFVFSWDGHNAFWGGRTTNYGAGYPAGLVGQIHTDGQIWATCMMQVYDALGRTATDKAFWAGLAMTNGSSSQQDAALAVRQAGINMGYSIAQLNVMSTILQGCGYIMPPFPVEIVDFSAERITDQTVLLHWTTAVESNNRGFFLERRTAQVEDFEEIGFVAGQQNSDALQDYQFVDRAAPAGMTQYRFRQEDLDGTSHFSEVRTVKGLGQETLEVALAPNPNQGQVEVQLRGVNPGESTVSIADLAGRTVRAPQAYQGDRYTLDVQELVPGIYLLKVQARDQTRTMRFVVQ